MADRAGRAGTDRSHRRPAHREIVGSKRGEFIAA